MKFQVVLIGSESSSVQNTGIHAIANETRKHGLETFCVDYIEQFSNEQILELADRINAITASKPILGINTNFVFEEKNIHLLISKIKPHLLVAGGVNRLFDWKEISFSDMRGTSRENDFVKLCLEHFEITKSLTPFEITSLRHTYTDDDVYPDGVSIPFQISRHCIFNCTFCNAVESRGKRLNWRKTDLMIEQMEAAQKRYKTNAFTCTANTFNDYADNCTEFLGALSDHSTLKNISFFAFMRFDMLLKQEALWPLYDKHIYSTFFGLETLQDKDSFFIRKGGREDQRKKDIMRVGENLPSILKMYGLIHGLPYSTEENTEASIKWLLESGVVDMVALSPLTISHQNEDFHASDLSLNPEKYGYSTTGRRPDIEKGFAKIISRTQLDWKRNSDGYTSEQAQNFVKYVFENYNMRPIPDRNPSKRNLMADGPASEYFKSYARLLMQRLQYHE